MRGAGTAAGEISLTREWMWLGVLALLWGASYAFIKLAVETIPPLTMVALRATIAGVLLLAILRHRGLAMPRSYATRARFFFQGCMNSILPFTLIAWGERYVDSGLAAILNSTSPIFVFLFTWMGTRHEPATLPKLVGVALGLAGIVAITGMDALAGLGQQSLAQLAIIAATVCYAVAAIFGRGFHGLPPILPAAGSMICAAAVMIPLSLVLDSPWELAPSLTSLTALACLGVFSTAGALVVYFRLLTTLGSIGTASVSYLRAGVSVVLGSVFLGERLSLDTLIGLALVLGGVAAMAGTPTARPAAASPRAS